jgi:transcription-repair coupling factor (superfamily II helicase)
MNLTPILEILDELPAYQEILATLAAGRVPEVLGLPRSARPLFLARLFADLNRPVLFLTGRIENVPVWQQALEAWLPAGQHLLRFPEPTPLPFERGPWSERSRQDRLAVLTLLTAGRHPLLPNPEQPPFVLASARSFLQKTLPQHRFLSSMRVLRVGQILELAQTMQDWQEIGYEQTSVVESPGQFSRRGGIIDIYPTASFWPVRVELFGDEVDTMRYFNPATQRSVDVDDHLLERVAIPPVREALPGRIMGLGSHLEAVAPPKTDDLPSWQDDIPLLLSGRPSPHIEYYLPLLYAKPANLLHYLPADALVVIDDWAEFADAAHELHDHADQIAADQPGLPPDFPSPLFTWAAIEEELGNASVLTLGHMQSREDAQGPRSRSALAEAFQPGPRYGGQVRPFMSQLQFSREDQERTVLVSSQAQRLADLWQQELRRESSTIFKAEIALSENLERLPAPGEILFVQGSLLEGFVLERMEGNRVLLNLLTDAEVFGWKRPAPRRSRATRPTAPETPFADVKPGDFIVHLEHGIGRFMGLVVRAIEGADREYLQVRYGNGDVLYVPVHHADRLSKWIGPEEHAPPLHRLGERHWRNQKARAQQAVAELADDLIALYAARETVSGHAFSPDEPWQAELEASFPYQETADQLRAIEEVKADMETAQPMDRLICGDVGYGKTEVALRAAFKAVMDGKQVAMLVPTTVLAQQHFLTFSQRLRTFPVVVEMLSRFRTGSQQAHIVRRLRKGQVDIVIGTHRLLSEDVSFKDLGLLVIDEEQRFGVSHKETLKRLRTEVDVLTMTATPIPRTLHFALSGLRDGAE